MGCNTYTYEGTSIHFSEGDEDTRCLCTFPHNDRDGIDIDRVKSLAYLGAVVKLIYEGKIKDEWVYIPHCLPKWIKKGIDNKFKAEDEKK